MQFTVVIPVRFASVRLPGKALADIAGKPMIQRVYEQAKKSAAQKVIVATDDKRISDVVNAFGGEVVMTSSLHASGTDRIQEVVRKAKLANDEIIINVQGDEPLIPPEVINQLANNIVVSGVQVASLYEVITSLDDVLDPNCVKLVEDNAGFALYFSRAQIPFDRDNLGIPSVIYKRHVGIYAYRAEILNEFVKWVPDTLEKIEKLEQLRFLRHGVQIHVAEAIESMPPGIDTQKDLERVRQLFV